MKSVFVDTSFYVASLSPHDTDHVVARKLLADFTGTFVTSEYVLLELGSFFSRPPDRTSFVDFARWTIADSATEVIWSNDDLFEDGLSLFQNRPDKNWSLTDCLSFVIMNRMDIQDAFSLDHHFVQAGFHVLPELDKE